MLKHVQCVQIKDIIDRQMAAAKTRREKFLKANGFTDPYRCIFVLCSLCVVDSGENPPN